MTYWLIIAAVFLLDVAFVWRTASASVATSPPLATDAEMGPVLVPVNFQGTRTEDGDRTFLESVS